MANAAEIIFGRDWIIEGERVRIRAIEAHEDGPRAECVNAEGTGYYVNLASLHETPFDRPMKSYLSGCACGDCGPRH